MKPSGRLHPAEVVFSGNGMALLESHHQEGFFMDWRRDPFPKLLFVVSGEGCLHRSRGEVAFQAPTLVVVPEGRRYRLSDTPGRPMSLYGVCLDRPSLLSCELIDAACGSWRVETRVELLGVVQELLREILVEERHSTPETPDLQLSLVCRILVALARSRASSASEEVATSQARVAAYHARLSSDFWKTTDLDAVAGSLGLSRRRFTQVFRDLAGESWLGCITRLRMEHASQLLRQTQLPVRSVAFECGYAELSSFYRIFKSTYAMSPGQWRGDGGS